MQHDPRGPTTPVAAIVSFRLGGTDGVSIEARKWEHALRTLGFTTRRIAGQILDSHRPDDLVVPELAIRADADPPTDVLEPALETADLVVVENLLSLPLNLPAARTLTKMLATHEQVVLRHHDLPWQRDEFAAVTELPPDLPDAAHVTINERSRRELAERGIDAVVIRNHFDFDAPLGDRHGARVLLGLSDRDLLLYHPVRAIARKNVPGAIEIAEAAAHRLPGHTIHYWLPGPAEDGYAPELERHLRRARVPVIRRADVDVSDAYAACDLVVFPSLWEGFGNPAVEAIAARKPVVVGDYPVARELAGLGLRFLSPTATAEIAAALLGTGPRATLEANVAAARRHLSLAELPARIAHVLRERGWLPARRVTRAS